MDAKYGYKQTKRETPPNMIRIVRLLSDREIEEEMAAGNGGSEFQQALAVERERRSR